MEKLNGKATLEQLYSEIQYHKKTNMNIHWKEKIRQIVETNKKDFLKVGKGAYALVA